MRRHGLLAAAPIAALLLTGAVGAQDDGGGDGGDGATARVIDASECVGEPRTVDEFVAISTAGGEPARAVQVGVPLGTPVSGEEKDAAITAIRALLACFNANDRLLGASLMTDNGVLRFYGPATDEAALRETFAQEVAPRTDEEAIRLLAVTDVSRTEQGTIQAFVVLNEPLLPPGGPETILVELVEADGALLIDNFVDFSQPAPEEAGSPPADE